MNIEIDASQVDALGGQFLTASDLMRPFMMQTLASFQAEMDYTAVGEMKGVTPIGEDDATEPRWKPDYQPGELQRSTLAATTVDGLLMETIVTQDAKSLPNEDGSGGGANYGEFVRDGRDSIQAPSPGRWSTGKQALLTPWGPRNSVGGAPANPYPNEAFAPMVTATLAMAYRWGEAIFERLSAGL